MGHLYHGYVSHNQRYILQRQKNLLFHIVSLFLVSDSTQIQQKNYFAMDIGGYRWIVMMRGAATCIDTSPSEDVACFEM